LSVIHIAAFLADMPQQKAMSCVCDLVSSALPTLKLSWRLKNSKKNQIKIRKFSKTIKNIEIVQN